MISEHIESVVLCVRGIEHMCERAMVGVVAVVCVDAWEVLLAREKKVLEITAQNILVDKDE